MFQPAENPIDGINGSIKNPAQGQCGRAGVPTTWREEVTLGPILQALNALPIGLKYSTGVHVNTLLACLAGAAAPSQKQLHTVK